MNKYMFKKNLLLAIDELILLEGIEFIDDYKFSFIILPILEEGKKYNSKDECMYLTVFSKENLEGKVVGLDDTVSVFSGFEPLFPLWIKISLKEKLEGVLLFELKTSLRFRVPSVVMNTGSKYPPFFIED